ncbi:MAG: AAA family ATPase [Halioglobus sp.]
MTRCTVFSDRHGKDLSVSDWPGSLLDHELAFDSKAALPLVKMALFGEKRTDRDCLRHDSNVRALTGAEVDYDKSPLNHLEAAQLLAAAEIACTVYTTPTDTPQQPKWRVIAPFSREYVGSEAEMRAWRRRAVEELERVLGPGIDAASYTLSQGFFIGQVKLQPDLKHDTVEGAPLDELIDIQDAPVVEAAPANPASVGMVPIREARYHLDCIGPPPQDYMQWLPIGMALKNGCGDAGFALWDAWSKQGPGYPGTEELRAKWQTFDPVRAGGITYAAVHTAAKAAGADMDKFSDPVTFLKAGSRPSLLQPRRVSRELRALRPIARDRLYGDMLLRGYVSMINGPGGTGKSVTTLTMGVGLALGRDLLDLGQQLRPRRVLIINNEDDYPELDMRLAAIAAAHELDQQAIDAMHERICYQSGYGQHLRIAAQEGRVITGELVDLCRSDAIDAVMLDPLVSLHDVEENDNNSMEQLVMTPLRQVAKRGNVGVLLSHHSRKGAQADSPDDNARGATSVVNSVRANFGLSRMTTQEAKQFEFPEDDAHLHIRLDDGKKNYAPPAKRATWLKMQEVEIPATCPDTGTDTIERVGVPVRAHLKERPEEEKMEWTPELVAKRCIGADAIPPSFTITGAEPYMRDLCRVLADNPQKPIAQSTLAKRLREWPEGEGKALPVIYAGEEYYFWFDKESGEKNLKRYQIKREG